MKKQSSKINVKTVDTVHTDTLGENDELLSKEYSNILKGLMALGIIFNHLSFELNYIYLKPFKYIGVVIGLFFFISGFGLTISMETKKDYFGKFKLRILKVLIPFAISFVIYTIYWIIMNEIKNKTIFSIVKYSWYIYEIILLYLLFYIFYKNFDFKKATIFFTVMLIIILVIMFYLKLSANWYRSSLSFIAGIIIAKYKKQISIFLKRKWLLKLFCITFLCFTLLVIGKFYNLGLIELFTYNIANILFILAVLIILSKVKKLNNKLFNFLGSISFEIYLYHGLILNAILRTSWNDIVKIIVIPLLSIIVASLIRQINKKCTNSLLKIKEDKKLNATKNLILADCDKDEIKNFLNGVRKTSKLEFDIKIAKCNGKRNFFTNVLRYLIYIFYPVTIFVNRKKYNFIICWQQFFGLFYSFYCNLFKVKKQNTVIVLNFTYKDKKGLIGKIYKKVMSLCLKNSYIDYIHVLSKQYAERISKEFNLSMKKFIIIPFGLDDDYEKYKNINCEYKNFSLSLGRSNRDYDFLIECWKKLPKENKLVIICDEYKKPKDLYHNIIIRNDIVGDTALKYVSNCKTMILPIKDGTIPSGDTVLLRAMSYCKPVIITKPSTLAEMYIKHNENGFVIEKDINIFYIELEKILKDSNKLEKVGKKARDNFFNNYSRYSMGTKIGEKLRI